jgi:peptidoglycan/xylan/chitin deacetylase (PgdA/CDA1 family)
MAKTGDFATDRKGSLDSTAEDGPCVALIIEGSRSHADQSALLALGQALTRSGLQVRVLPHGLGRLSRRFLLQTLTQLRPQLILVTGAASLRDARRAATTLGCPLVCYYWPHGVVHDVHAPHGPPRHSPPPSPPQQLVVADRSADKQHRLRTLPTRIVVATAEQQQAARLYFAQAGVSLLDPERVHVLPKLPDEPGPRPPLSGSIDESVNNSATAESAAHAQALTAHVTLLTEMLGERAHRSMGRALLRGMVGKASRLLRPQSHILLCYHRVVRELRGFDLNLVVTESTLLKQVQALLQRGYQPLRTADQLQLLRGETPPTRPTFSLGFDDGYLDTLTVAAPLLQSLQVPFSVYVISDVVLGRMGLPWYELLAQALLHTETREQTLRILQSEPQLQAVALAGAARPGSQAVPHLLAACKALPGELRDHLTTLLRQEVEHAVRALPWVPRYLDVGGVRRLQALGAEISSHTRSHPILPTLSDEALRDELVVSRQALQGVCGTCVGLAYPNGDGDARVHAAAQQAGYEYAATVTPTPVLRSGTRPDFVVGRRVISELSSMGIDGRFSTDVFTARVFGLLGH